MTPDATATAYAQFRRVLDDEGLRPALAFLGARTDYRYIGIFRFQDGRATAAAFVDREQPHVTTTDEVPATATYCCYVRDEQRRFTTADALLDPRLVQHAARAQVRAYCGVPLIDPEGVLLGTLCHYDVVPRDPAQIDIELMVQVAATLAGGGHVPPYPGR